MEEYRTLNLADIGHTSQTPDSNTKEISPKPKTQKLPIKQKKTKQEKQKKKQRNWTKDEVDCFARVLVEYSFVQQLEQRALKKKANLEVFEKVVPLLRAELQKEDFREINEMNNFTRKGAVIEYPELICEAACLQVKYKDLKYRWRNITTSARRGSGEEGATDATWYQLLNPIFSETNGDLSEIVNGAEDLEVYEQIGGEREEREVMADELPADKKQKLTLTVAKPTNPPPRVRTQSQGLALLGKSLTEFGSQQSKIISTATEKANERHEEYLKFMAEQRELDRKHELQMFKMLLEHTNQNNRFTSTQPMPTQLMPTQPMPTQPMPTQPMPTQPMTIQPMTIPSNGSAFTHFSQTAVPRPPSSSPLLFSQAEPNHSGIFSNQSFNRSTDLLE